jgi:hypothetical protein
MVPRKRSKPIDFVLLTHIFLLFLVFGSCNWGIPDYSVTVILEEGVTGTPEAGVHNYAEGSTLNYEYQAENPIYTLEVLIDNTRQSSSGSLSIWTGFTLTARLVDIRGSWNMKMQWTDSTEVNFDFSVTFDGSSLLSGSFTDSRGYHGLWSAENGTIVVTYADWSDFVLSGSAYSMTGSFTGEANTGTWQATRVN